MSYSYESQKHRLLTEDGVSILLQIRDKADKCLKDAGAAMSSHLLCASGDSWIMLAAIDHLVRLGELREIDQGGYVAGQHRIFVAGPKHRSNR